MAPVKRRRTRATSRYEEREDEQQLKDDKIKVRSKNFTEPENEVLLSACDKFHSIINKNTNRDVDKTEKSNAWKKIKQGFDNYCKVQGIYVSKNLIEKRICHKSDYM